MCSLYSEKSSLTIAMLYCVLGAQACSVYAFHYYTHAHLLPVIIIYHAVRFSTIQRCCVSVHMPANNKSKHRPT